MRSRLAPDDLAGVLAGRTLEDVSRLAGGSVKGVYRLTLGDGSTCVAYRWHADENFWPAVTPFDVGPFSGDSSLAGFLDRHGRLRALGVRVPEIFGVDPEAQVALVEDVRGGKLEDLLERDAAGGREVVARLAAALRTMHEHRVPGCDCAGFVLERGLRSLAAAVPRDQRIAAHEDRFRYELSKRSTAVQPRDSHGVIHGELGPDHVLVDDHGEPVLIDIEGTMPFDAEWEHAFLELRFGSWYPLLRTVELDPARMRLYRLVQYLSLVAGPLILVEGDFPNPGFMREIAHHNGERAIAEVG